MKNLTFLAGALALTGCANAAQDAANIAVLGETSTAEWREFNGNRSIPLPAGLSRSNVEMVSVAGSGGLTFLIGGCVAGDFQPNRFATDDKFFVLYINGDGLHVDGPKDTAFFEVNGLITPFDEDTGAYSLDRDYARALLETAARGNDIVIDHGLAAAQFEPVMFAADTTGAINDFAMRCEGKPLVASGS